MLDGSSPDALQESVGSQAGGSAPLPSGFDPRRLQYVRRAARDFILRYRFSINLFCEEILQTKLDPWQVDANEAICDYVRWQYKQPMKVQKPNQVRNWFTVKAMHGPGKTFWGATLICWFGSVFPDARIPCVAPKLDQLKTRLWLEIKKVRAQATEDFQLATKDIGSLHMRWYGDDAWTAFGQTATHAENLAGLHNDYMLVFVDEASGVNENLYPTIMGALSTGRVIIFVMISNPSKNVGSFAQSWLKPNVAKRYFQVNITLEKAPRVSRDWVQAMIDKYGEGSPIVKIRCFGEFADDNALQLIATTWLHQAFDREVPATEGLHSKLRISIDVADGGEDESVVTAAREYEFGRVILAMRRFSFEASVAPIKAADAGEEMFVEFGGRKGIDELVVDGLGVGAGTAGTLLTRGHRVVVHKGGEAASDPAKWRNRRVQNYCACRDAYRDGRIFFQEAWNLNPKTQLYSEQDVDELLAQLASVEINPGTERVDDLITKEQMRAKGLKSPDMGDSLSMQWSSAMQAGQGLMDFTRLKAEAAKATREKITQGGGMAALMGQKT